jgi:hypothetical protein
MRFQSNAQWPLNGYRGMYGDGISTDTHATKEQAGAVCAALLERGFSGEEKHFPLKVWISEVDEQS